MNTSGKHLLAEYWDCNRTLLDDPARVEALLREAASLAGATVVESCFHTFSPQGVTGVVVVEESHLSIHTWPEAGYAAVDFFTCGDCDPWASQRFLLAGLGAGQSETLLVRRGLTRSPGGSLEVDGHDTQVAGTSPAPCDPPTEVPGGTLV